MIMPICFIATETTGLRPDDEIWEFAGRRYNVDGTVDELHLFIDHDQKRAQHLPVSFSHDYMSRFPASKSSQYDAAEKIQRFTLGAHIIGAVPSFDTEKLAIMMRAQDLEPRWHYHLCDIENVVVGYLAGLGRPVPPPWSSEELSLAVGVDPAEFARHTAMGDVVWVEAQWHAVMRSGATGE